MNIVLNSEKINMNNIFFLDTKRNVIIDGKFTKLIYSDSSVIMNGIYIDTPFFPYTSYRNSNRTTLYISHDNMINVRTMNLIYDIEERLLEKFRHHSKSNKSMVHSIREQLITRCFKTFHEFSTHDINHSYILRISGIWENATSIGVTFRFNSVTDIESSKYNAQ